VVEPARTDVVRPAVAADEPDTAPDQVVHDRKQRGRFFVATVVAQLSQLVLEYRHPLALRADLATDTLT
jgi:hypothetical protein